MHGVGGKHREIEAKDKLKVVDLYVNHGFTLTNLHVRFPQYTVHNMRQHLVGEGVAIRQSKKVSAL